MTPDTYRERFLTDLDTADANSPRTQQSHARVLGFSDIGGCPEAGRRFLAGDPFTDTTDMTAARVGNWMDAGLKKVREDANPHLLLDLRVECLLPSGIRIKGHPDEVDPTVPLVVDYKSKDGLAGVRRTGPSDQHRMQRALQYLACLQAGVFATEDGWVGNIYFDRSGHDPVPYVDLQPWKQEKVWVERADAWVLDALRHAQNGTPAERTEYRPFCERFCRFFSACRGADVYDELLIEGTKADLIALYHEAHTQEKQGKALKEALREDLLGLSGVTATHSIRTSSDNKLSVAVLDDSADIAV